VDSDWKRLERRAALSSARSGCCRIRLLDHRGSQSVGGEPVDA
jgi:hypothetical protein